jgi:glutamine amidotransferase
MLNMLGRVGVESRLVSKPAEILESDHIVLPGVGAFDHGVSALHARDLVEPLRSRAMDGVPLLGVCLGMQLLGRKSEEGKLEGLGLLDAESVRFSAEPESRLKIPHMGWCHLIGRRPCPLPVDLQQDARFYFVHSYHMICRDPADEAAAARYGVEFTAMVQRGNVMGVQFHPEKSHRYGMKVLQNFARL